MSRNQDIQLDINDGIDRKTLSQLKARFLSISAGRLERAMEALSTRQQMVLKLLPLLFHVNHPLLPGFTSTNTPAGLSGYEPSEHILAEAQRLTRSFQYKPARGKVAQPIYGLFLMGSLGTLAQADNSDMDVWVCHDPSLTAEQLHELQCKCALLEEWATSQGAEAHFFLVDPQRFTQGERETQLTSDDCGTTQHYLLLDEFYRTAIWLGGRTPLWWLVPTYEESRYREYVHTLISKRFIRAEDFLDLGHLAQIPPGEFVGSGMWQLYKGIESPYKSVLKLLLTEVYASEHPNVTCLALRFKQAVYANQVNLDELDPYVVVYRRLEEHLSSRHEHERLELVRRCFYLKTKKQISHPPRNGRKSWQRKLLERMTQEWQWEARQIAMLDRRRQWKVRQVMSERRVLVNELTYSYRFLSQFARQLQISSTLNSRDLSVLGRRLYAAFERKAGKVEFINPGIAPDLAEETLTLVQAPQADSEDIQWALYPGTLTAQEWPNFAPFKRSRELIELLAWCHRNGVIDYSTRLSLHPGSSDLSEFELFNLLSSLQQMVPLPLPPVAEEAFLKPAHAQTILLLINVGIDPLRQHSQNNIHMTSGRTDSLGYSGVRENLVQTIDQISLSSWHEMLVNRYDGPEALLDCICELLNSLPQGAELPDIQVRCFCRNRAPAISSRVETLLNDLLQLYHQQSAHRYLIQIGQQLHLIDLTWGQVSHTALTNIAALEQHLGQEQSHCNLIKIDPHTLEDNDLRLILKQAQADCIQVFYRIFGDQAEISVLDERNALWRQRLPYRDVPTLLAPLQRFFQSMLYRLNTQLSLDGSATYLLPEVRYYELLPSPGTRSPSVVLRNEPRSEIDLPFYNVQAIFEPGEQRRNAVTLYCNQREFSELEYGNQLFSRVAEHILAQRREAERYPCYITDLDLSAVFGDGPVQTIHFLRHKTALEQALNGALQNA